MDRLIEPALSGFPVAWFSPAYPMLTDIWREVRGVLQPITTRANAQEHRIELMTGGIVDMWSLDNPDSVRGRKYKRAVVDEAAMVKGLKEAWNAVIRPTLTDFKGDGWFLSTPRGMDFFWEGFSNGQSPDHPEWMSWQMPTTANPFIDPAEVEEARKSLPERIFEQEYLAAFLEDAGGVFRGVRAVVDTGRTDNEPPKPGIRYALGLDLARVQDFTVLSVMDQTGRQVYHERFNQISWERQLASVTRVAKQYNAPITMDSTGVGDPIFEALRRAGLKVQGYHFTNQSKEELIDGLAMAIENRQVSLMDIPQQTTELLAYQYELTPSRNVRMNAPEGMNDDCVIALALSHYANATRRQVRVLSS